jgi:hypothetical protein
VTRIRKTVISCNLVCPGFKFVRFNLDSLAAVAANQVMVVSTTTGSIEHLSIGRLQGVCFTD